MCGPEMTENVEQLTAMRCQIDGIDEQMLELLNQRAKLAQSIGRMKQGMVYRAEREAQVLRRIATMNHGPLDHEAVMRLFREIMSACLALEKPLRVAYLGPQGTFSQAASIRQFGHAALQQPCISIDEVFRSVEVGHADYGVVPVENSTEGAVNRTLDLLQTSRLSVGGEVDLRIHQSVLRKVNGLDGVTVVYSHSQSLAQCHDWLSAHLPGVSQVAVASNAEAAKLAEQNEQAVAIAGEHAAEVYGLLRVADRIEDEADNTTRFVVIAREDVSTPSGQDKTSLLLAAPNCPGAIVSLLEPFRAQGVSLTKLESRPARHDFLGELNGDSPWEYVFFVDIEGHREDNAVKKALQAMSTSANFVRILGSYPKCVL